MAAHLPVPPKPRSSSLPESRTSRSATRPRPGSTACETPPSPRSPHSRNSRPHTAGPHHHRCQRSARTQLRPSRLSVRNRPAPSPRSNRNGEISADMHTPSHRSWHPNRLGPHRKSKRPSSQTHESARYHHADEARHGTSSGSDTDSTACPCTTRSRTAQSSTQSPHASVPTTSDARDGP